MGMKSFSHIQPLKQWNPQKTKQTKANQEILATALQTVYIEDKKRFSEYDEAKHNEKNLTSKQPSFCTIHHQPIIFLLYGKLGYYESFADIYGSLR